MTSQRCGEPSSLQVSIACHWVATLPELARFAERCEQAGLSGIGVPDHHHTGRDAYLTLAAMAQRTHRMTLFPATSNVVTRHPLVMASLIGSLEELDPRASDAHGGARVLSVERAGEPQARRQRLGEVVLALRGLLGEGRATLDGHDLTLDNRPEDGSRVIVLASGPKQLELAGEVADGVMMLVGLDPRSVEAARHHVRRGADRAGRDVASLEEIFIVPFGLGDDQATRAWPQGWFRGKATSGCDTPARPTCTGSDTPVFDLPADYDPAAVSDDLATQICEAFGLFGTPEQCAERLLRARDEVGLAHVFLFPTHTWANHYQLPVAELRPSVTSSDPHSTTDSRRQL
jgi:5,10-methylenetetrahydromethanopterin reductase